jgi:serine/threonine protein kinase
MSITLQNPVFRVLQPELFANFASGQKWHSEVQLGQGAFGSVFLIRNANGALYAIKRFPTLAEEREKLSPLQDTSVGDVHPLDYDQRGVYTPALEEFSIAQVLRHPNIVRIYDYILDTKEGEVQTCLLMEFVDGRTLDEIPSQSLSLRSVYRNLIQFIDAYSHCLTKGYLTTDFCEDNVMIDTTGTLKFIDLYGFQKIEDVVIEEAYLLKKGNSRLTTIAEDNSSDEEKDESLQGFFLELTSSLEMLLRLGPFSPEKIDEFRSLCKKTDSFIMTERTENWALTSKEFTEFALQFLKEAETVVNTFMREALKNEPELFPIKSKL